MNTTCSASRTVLVTGGTGVIGSSLVPLLLQNESTKVYLLLRSKTVAEFDEKIKRLFAFWDASLGKVVEEGRLSPLVGDVSLPLLGLSLSQYRCISREVTNIIHAAGDVRLNRPLEEARRQAVYAAQNITELATLCQEQGHFTKLEFVSSVGIAGCARVLPEGQVTKPREFRNTYDEVKAEAETHVYEKIAGGLPITIYRPSMVVGNSQSGRVIRFQVFYYLCDLLAGIKTWGLVPDVPSLKLDLIPVDYVAKAISIASAHPETSGCTFNLCSGYQNAVSIDKLRRHLNLFHERSGLPIKPLWRINLDYVMPLVPFVQTIVPRKARGILKSLPYLYAYLKTDQIFEVRATHHFFSKAGLFVPTPDNYIQTVLQYYWDFKRERT